MKGLRVPFGYRVEERALPGGEAARLLVPDEPSASLLRAYVEGCARGAPEPGLPERLAALLGGPPPETLLLDWFAAGLLLVRAKQECYLDLDELREHTEYQLAEGTHEALVERPLLLRAFARLPGADEAQAWLAERLVCDACGRPAARGGTSCGHLGAPLDPREWAAHLLFIAGTYFRGTAPAERLYSNWPADAAVVSSLAGTRARELQRLATSGASVPRLERRLAVLTALARGPAGAAGQAAWAWAPDAPLRLVERCFQEVRVRQTAFRATLTLETDLVEPAAG